MVAHAFFKALLFLGAGSVIHALDGEQEHAKDGRTARSSCRSTFPTFLVGWLAISGIPPFAGFFAEGRRAHQASASTTSRSGSLGVADGDPHRVLHDPALRAHLHAAPSASARTPQGHDPHESPWVMTLPLVVLAVLSSSAA